MKSMIKYLSLLSVLLATITVSPIIQAQQLPKHYPTTLEAEGYIHGANFTKQLVNLDGATYRITPNTVVYNRLGKKVSLFNLTKGTKVGVKFIRSKNKRWAIEEFWILPSNYKVEPHAG